VLLFTALVTPYELGFLEIEFRASDDLFWLFVCDRIVDFCFFCDIAINFYLAFVDGRGVLIIARPKIVARYLKSWFIVDFMSAIPFDLISVVIASEDGSDLSDAGGGIARLRFLRFFRLLRALKLLRILVRLAASD
jgi:hypothetical protein